MEDYEEFCSGISVQLRSETGPQRSPLGQEVVSSIRFHGRPVLLPLLNEDLCKKMSHYKQQAAQLEAERHRQTQSSLLARVQDILNSVQLRKVKDQPEKQASQTCGSPEPGSINSSSPQPDKASRTCCAAVGGPVVAGCSRDGTAVSQELEVEQEQKATEGESDLTHSMTEGSASGSMEREQGHLESEGLYEGLSVLKGSYSDGENEDSRSRVGLQGDDSVICTPPQYRLKASPQSPDSLLGSLPHSLTGSYACLPSPDPSLNPVLHRCPLRPILTPGSFTTGNILISCPMSAVKLSPMASGKGQDKGVLGNWVSTSAVESSGKRWMDFLSLPNSPLPSASSKWENSTAASSVVSNEGLIDSICTPSISGPNRVSPIHDEGSPPTPNPHSHISFQLGSHTPPSPSPEKGSRSPAPCLRSSPAPLNRSYDVESPVLTLQRPCVAPELALLSPSQVPHIRLESWNSSRTTHSHLTRPTEGKDNTAVAIQRQIQALENMRQRLEEEHAHQLSLLVSEQQQEQQSLHQTLQEKERGLRRGQLSTLPPAGHPGNYRESLNSTWASVLMLQSLGPAERFPPGPSLGTVPPLRDGRPLQMSSPGLQRARSRLGAVARGFLTRRLLDTEKVKHLRKTVGDTKEFIRSFQKRGPLSPQDRILQERGRAQLRAALFDMNEIFFVLPPRERVVLIQQDRELRTERRLRDMEKARSPRDKVTLSAATQKSLERKRQRLKESLRQGKQINLKPKSPSTCRILQPNQDQNAPPSSLPRLLASLFSKEEQAVCPVAQKKHL